jgi:hypothetical protein
MRISVVWAALCVLALWTIGCGSSDGESGAGATGGQGGSGGMRPAPAIGCDPLTPSYCGFPYPNNYFTVEDLNTGTGRRLALPAEAMPVDEMGRASNPDAFNEMDGFSPGIAAMTHLPGATVMGLATPNTIADSLGNSSPTVILNADTAERVPHWVDRDEWVFAGSSTKGERWCRLPRPSWRCATGKRGTR